MKLSFMQWGVIFGKIYAFDFPEQITMNININHIYKEIQIM